MNTNNNLTGLNGFGFKNSTTKFEASVFENNKTIEQLRPVIKKHFSPAKTVYKGSSRMD